MFKPVTLLLILGFGIHTYEQSHASDDNPLLNSRSIKIEKFEVNKKPGLRILETRITGDFVLRLDEFNSENGRDRKLVMLEQERHSGLNSTGFVRLLGTRGEHNSWLDSSHSEIGFEAKLLEFQVIIDKPKSGMAQLEYSLDGKKLYTETYSTINEAQERFTVQRRFRASANSEGKTLRIKFDADCKKCPSPAYIKLEFMSPVIQNVAYTTERQKRENFQTEPPQNIPGHLFEENPVFTER